MKVISISTTEEWVYLLGLRVRSQWAGWKHLTGRRGETELCFSPTSTVFVNPEEKLSGFLGTESVLAVLAAWTALCHHNAYTPIEWDIHVQTHTHTVTADESDRLFSRCEQQLGKEDDLFVSLHSTLTASDYLRGGRRDSVSRRQFLIDYKWWR